MDSWKPIKNFNPLGSWVFKSNNVYFIVIILMNLLLKLANQPFITAQDIHPGEDIN